MADILDEILQEEKTPESSVSDTPKPDFKEVQKKNRDEAYTIANKAVENIASNGEAFRAYLDVQSRFKFFSVNNALLVQAQMPQATQLKEFNEWKKDGVQIQAGSKGIWLMRAGKPYTGQDGRTYTPHNAHKVFDVSQTNAKPAPAVQFDGKLVLRALLHKSPVKIVATEEPIGGARYMPEGKEIQVQKGMDVPDLIRTVSMELAKAQLDKAGQGDPFRAYCVSYMLCKRYGIDVSGYQFEQLPEAFSSLDGKAMRKELNTIKDALGAMDKRMYANLNPEKADRKKNTEAR